MKVNILKFTFWKFNISFIFPHSRLLWIRMERLGIPRKYCLIFSSLWSIKFHFVKSDAETEWTKSQLTGNKIYTTVLCKLIEFKKIVRLRLFVLNRHITMPCHRFRTWMAWLKYRYQNDDLIIVVYLTSGPVCICFNTSLLVYDAPEYKGVNSDHKTEDDLDGWQMGTLRGL